MNYIRNFQLVRSLSQNPCKCYKLHGIADYLECSIFLLFVRIKKRIVFTFAPKSFKPFRRIFLWQTGSVLFRAIVHFLCVKKIFYSMKSGIII